MVIIWGKKLNRVRKGVVGHFCPVCRDVRVFSCQSVWRVSHIYYIPLGDGEHVVDEFTCADCGVLLGMEAGAASKARPALEGDVFDFAADTGPLGVEGLAERLEWEERLRAGVLSPDERKGVIGEAIADLEYMAQQRAQSGSTDGISIALLILSLAGGVGTAMLWHEYLTRRRPATVELVAWLVVVTALTVVMFGVLIWRSATHTRRVSGPLNEPVSRSLAPLRPSREELEEVVGVMKRAGSIAAKGVRVDDVLKLIDPAR